VEKPGFDRFFQELVPKPTGFWNKLNSLIKAEVIRLITEKYSVSEGKALDMFYTSATAASLDDDETGLYGQSPLYIFSIFNMEVPGSYPSASIVKPRSR
jgi:hypothetical protein